jgi:2-haloacid dehalogenase
MLESRGLREIACGRLDRVGSPSIAAVVFDLGGVLIDWDPRYLYRTLFDDERQMEEFLSTVTTQDWNQAQDAGRPWTEAIEELTARHPERRDLIEAYWHRWPETLGAAIEPTVRVLDELRSAGVGLYALSNWSGETFPIARPSYPFLEWFDGIVISGDEGVIKPDPRIFQVLIDRYGLEPSSTVFIDDHAPNVEAAKDLGFRAFRFVDADTLRSALRALGVLPASR